MKPTEKKQPDISILIPYKGGNPHRDEAVRWLLKFYKNAMPDAQIVFGRSKDRVFCKTQAFNDAAKKAKGKVWVLMDADAYIHTKRITRAVERILENKEDRLWYVPYRHLYRLTKEVSQRLVDSDPIDPIDMPDPMPPDWIDGDATKSTYGHRYGAMMMIIPREAYEVLGCFDERFKGWGGEDIAILRALDTLYGKHKTTKNPIYHLWHPTKGTNYRDRTWQGQAKQHPNDKLAEAYHKATRKPREMRKLVDEGCESRKISYRIKKKLEGIYLWIKNLINKVLGYFRIGTEEKG